MDDYHKSLLLANIKQSVVHWFLAGGQHIAKAVDCTQKWSYEHSAFQQIQTNNVEILLHGLQIIDGQMSESKTESFMQIENETDALRKLIEDYEWVRRTTQIHDAFKTVNCDISHQTAQSLSTTVPFVAKCYDEQNIIGSTKSNCHVTSIEVKIKQFFCSWILRNLKSNCLCSCLQTLIADKELLNLYYTERAFLQSEKYSTALLICLSALELNRYSLLSQLNPDLLLQATNGASGINAAYKAAKHKRSSSHPTFSLSPPKKSSYSISARENALNGKKVTKSRERSAVMIKCQPPMVFPTFRKTRSLPEIRDTWRGQPVQHEIDKEVKNRPRSKTVCVKPSIKLSVPKPVPKQEPFKQTDQYRFDRMVLSTSIGNSSYSDDDILPSTSASSRYSQISNATLQSHSTLNSNSVSTSSTSSKSTARKIELIKCDDIKIWTDQSAELKGQSPSREPPPQTASCDIPQKSQHKMTKSVSPINSFLSSLFTTPPTYTSWAVRESPNESDPNVRANVSTSEAIPCDENNSIDCLKSNSVFDGFLPAYGQKLHSRPSQTLFEDGISTLDDAGPPGRRSSQPVNTSLGGLTNKDSQCTLKSCEDLSSFLQLSHLSRNNTELEKENAHFRISEAIISAIEHIKWAKIDSEKQQTINETAIGADWLQHEPHYGHSSSARSETEITVTEANEHIPYAELGDSNWDLLSAEVVGLALISKFNDKQLPKVSKLKWLVSDDDTPQNLLPMPDSNPGANPDENIIPSITRGTRYWAPPRPQIIFTDHPPPNRKQLIRKQNYRCAGCGMRVSAELLHSFRYCTYLGKYHCTGCHRNQICAIPAKILHNWDFKCYPVSVFAYRLLEKMFTFPLFYVPDLNPALYINNKVLLVARNKRQQLRYTKDFIKTCRFALREQHYFNAIPDHITNDPDIWAMSDFIDARNKSMKRSIDELIHHCEQHIFNCVLCTARGFFCEYCRKEEIIFPWGSKTFRCERCGSCFHTRCWKQMLEICQRCQRISKRRIQTDDEI